MTCGTHPDQSNESVLVCGIDDLTEFVNVLEPLLFSVSKSRLKP